jgi:predicted DNA-binding transcriptional regulator AlpA
MSDDVYLPGRKVEERFGISSMTRWRWERDPALDFPKPIVINGRKFWSLRGLELWERSRAASSAVSRRGR